MCFQVYIKYFYVKMESASYYAVSFIFQGSDRSQKCSKCTYLFTSGIFVHKRHPCSLIFCKLFFQQYYFLIQCNKYCIVTMSALNLKHYPDVCRVCLKADSGAMHSVAEDFKVIPLKVQTFLDEVTFRIQEVSLMISICRAGSRSLFRDFNASLQKDSIFNSRSLKSILNKLVSIVSFFIIIFTIIPDSKFYRLQRNLQTL